MIKKSNRFEEGMIQVEVFCRVMDVFYSAASRKIFFILRIELSSKLIHTLIFSFLELRCLQNWFTHWFFRSWNWDVFKTDSHTDFFVLRIEMSSKLIHTLIFSFLELRYFRNTWKKTTICYFPVTSGFCVLLNKSMNQSIRSVIVFECGGDSWKRVLFPTETSVVDRTTLANVFLIKFWYEIIRLRKHWKFRAQLAGVQKLLYKCYFTLFQNTLSQQNFDRKFVPTCFKKQSFLNYRRCNI